MKTREEVEIDRRSKVVSRFKSGITKTMIVPGGKRIKNYHAFISYCLEKDKQVEGLAWITTVGWENENG